VTAWARPKAWFMIFRIQAVMVWAVATVAVGTAFAYHFRGTIDWVNLFLCVTIASIVQGFPAHIVNEVTDWDSGADRVRPGKSGGSKVLLTGLATAQQLWRMFRVTSLIAFLLVAWLCYRTSWGLGILFLMGYAVCIFYTLPPVRLAYRPFLGEWLGGFAGIVINIVGSYAAQTGTFDFPVFRIALPIGMIYIGIMLLFHYVDIEGDREARPIKRTTIVFLGLRRSQSYILIILMVAFGLAVFESLSFPMMLWLAGIAALHIPIHWTCNPSSADSVVRAGKGLMVTTIIGVTGFSASTHPAFTLLIPVIIFARWLHKKFGKLPIDWRPSHEST